ncbi:hypothetical protein CVT25_008010, partial [Psilocybe cyanescens]
TLKPSTLLLPQSDWLYSKNGSIYSRINILYFLDSLCGTCPKVMSHSKSESSRATNANGLYVELMTCDLNRIIDSIVPEGRQWLPNLVSAKQILENWRSKRDIDPQRIDVVFSSLESHPKISSSNAAESSKHAPSSQ